MTRISTVRSSFADIRHQLLISVAALARMGVETAALGVFVLAVVLWADALFGRG